MQVVLASASPRRHELLKQLVQDFIIKPTDIDEDALTTIDPFQTAETLAFEKAKAAIDPANPQIIIGCDTVVALKQDDTWTQFTKPTDNVDAIRILKSLRNRTHQVITGVAILTPTQTEVSHCVTDVTFNDVTDQEIENYVLTGEPLDKAGAYGAQGMGHFLVKSLDGPFDNVVGLPLELTKILLTNVGYFEPNLS
jgi:septum formation protein